MKKLCTILKNKQKWCCLHRNECHTHHIQHTMWRRVCGVNYKPNLKALVQGIIEEYFKKKVTQIFDRATKKQHLSIDFATSSRRYSYAYLILSLWWRTIPTQHVFHLLCVVFFCFFLIIFLLKVTYWAGCYLLLCCTIVLLMNIHMWLY